MEQDYISDIRKYTSNVDETAVASIVRYCSISLRGKDSRLVSFSDDAEIKRVVDGFCSKKLDLEPKTAEAAVCAVGERMKSEKNKHRVTVYYLVAEHTQTLSKLA